jgi:Rap1a immunity proteins
MNHRHLRHAGLPLSTFALGAVLLALAAPTRADDVSPPAKEWRSYCQSYLKALEGDVDASDLDVTYCLGVTKGLLSGLRVGAQLGALSFGSRIAVRHQLDADAIFKLFQEQDPSRLLGICAPASASTPDFIRPVLVQLEKNPGDAERPIAEVFYETLATAYPCR